MGRFVSFVLWTWIREGTAVDFPTPNNTGSCKNFAYSLICKPIQLERYFLWTEKQSLRGSLRRHLHPNAPELMPKVGLAHLLSTRT